jgi:hypothetical protein
MSEAVAWLPESEGHGRGHAGLPLVHGRGISRVSEPLFAPLT